MDNFLFESRPPRICDRSMNFKQFLLKTFSLCRYVVIILILNNNIQRVDTLRMKKKRKKKNIDKKDERDSHMK